MNVAFSVKVAILHLSCLHRGLLNFDHTMLSTILIPLLYHHAAFPLFARDKVRAAAYLQKMTETTWLVPLVSCIHYPDGQSRSDGGGCVYPAHHIAKSGQRWYFRGINNPARSNERSGSSRQQWCQVRGDTYKVWRIFTPSAATKFLIIWSAAIRDYDFYVIRSTFNP